MRLNVQARATATHLTIDYALANASSVVAYVFNRDLNSGQPSGFLEHLTERLAFVLVDSARPAPGISFYAPPRLLAVRCEPGQTLEASLVLPLPLAESGTHPRPFTPPDPSPPETVAIDAVLLALGYAYEAPGLRVVVHTKTGGLELSGGAPSDWLYASAMLPAPCPLLRRPGQVSMIDHALPAGQPRRS